MAKTLVTGVLLVGGVAAVSPGGSAQGDPPLYVSSTPAGAQDCTSWANACTLSDALTVRTTANAQIEMSGGAYGSAGNDAINANGDLGANDDNVTITGGYSGVTTLDPGANCTGSGIVDFSGVTGVTVDGLTVNATASACGSPVANTGGTNDTLGATSPAVAVDVGGGAPTTAVNLTGGSTTIDDVTVDPSYTHDGLSCSGSATCTVSDSTVTGSLGTTGILVEGASGATVGPSDVISDNTAGGVILEGSTGDTVGPSDTIFDNVAGGVLLQGTTGAFVSNNTFASNAGGAVVGSSSDDQSSNDTVSGNTVTGTTNAGVVLETTGGYTITNNTVTGLGEGGEGFILVGSDDDTISANTASGSAAGAVVTGNDLTGPSTGSTISNNDFSSNLLGGAVADGFGSPESWNKPGSGNQGIQGVVFFQSDTAVAANAPITSACPDAALTSCVEAVDPTAFSQVPGAYEAVAGYLAELGATCDAGAPSDGGIPVGQDGYVSAGMPDVVACTDGAGDIFLATPYASQGATVSSPITVGNGQATGALTSSEPGCESSPPLNTEQPSCTGSVLTLPTLTSYNTVAAGNSFVGNGWTNETIAGAIDGSGPNGQFITQQPTFIDDNPDDPTNIENTWTGNSCDLTAATPECTATRPPVSTTVASSNITLGNSNSTTATVTGTAAGGSPTGSVNFYECGPTVTPEPCQSTSNQVGSAVGLTSGPSDTASATSEAFTPTTSGFWCFAAVYSGDEFHYTGSSDTTTDECFAVIGMFTTPTSSFVVAGSSNSDTASVTGTATGGSPTGSVSFYECGPTVTPEPCTSQADAVGSAVTLTAGPDDTATAASVSFVPGAPGFWCFAAYYSGGPNYGANSETATDECFVMVELGSISGTVTDSANPPNPVSGADVYACGIGAEVDYCYDSTTGNDGSFDLSGVPDGTYTVTVSPAGNSLDEQTSSPITVSGTSATTENIVLSAPILPPDGTFVAGQTGGVPHVNWSSAIPIRTEACPGGTVSVTITGIDTDTGVTETSVPVMLTEVPADSGSFVGSLPAAEPIHGVGTVTMSITNCSDPSGNGTVTFTIYIDPSGTVVDADHADAPVPGATVTLLSSDSLTGTYTPVTNDSAVMSPGNRTNPDTTNAEGTFGWDTTPGFYEVQATKAGCGTSTTAAFRVPPAVENLQLVLHCASRLVITTGAHLPDGMRGVHYSTTLAAVGGNAPYTWKIAPGSRFPRGLKLRARSGVISGRPQNADSGTYTFTVKVLDQKMRTRRHPATRNTATQVFTINIS
jgi:parallel beta-helix repeat protein